MERRDGRLGAIAVVVMALLAAGCARRSGGDATGAREASPTSPVAARALPAFADDLPADSLAEAVDRTRPAWRKRNDTATPVAADRLLALLPTTSANGDRRRAIADAFTVLEVRGSTLMTSYYEPELAVRLEPDARFRWPIHARPADLVEVDAALFDPSCQCRSKLVGRLTTNAYVPYWSRGDIYAGALDEQDLELAWTDDLLGLFMLQVQGSGRMRLPDGRVVPLRFAGTNGRSYRSLAQVLIDRKLLTREDATLPGIRRAVAALPESEQLAMLAENPRYGFFQVGGGPGPVGSLGVALTPGRSIAADPKLVPPGSIVWLEMPSARRFVVVQDTGAAITGAHVDLFAGAGADAEAFAGGMRDRGRMYLLVPR